MGGIIRFPPAGLDGDISLAIIGWQVGRSHCGYCREIPKRSWGMWVWGMALGRISFDLSDWGYFFFQNRGDLAGTNNIP